MFPCIDTKSVWALKKLQNVQQQLKTGGIAKNKYVTKKHALCNFCKVPLLLNISQEIQKNEVLWA